MADFSICGLGLCLEGHASDLNSILSSTFYLCAKYGHPWSTNEPRHEISNNVVCATSKDSDQPAHTRSLIRAFASRLNISWKLSYWLNIIWSFICQDSCDCRVDLNTPFDNMISTDASMSNRDFVLYCYFSWNKIVSWKTMSSNISQLGGMFQISTSKRILHTQTIYFATLLYNKKTPSNKYESMCSVFLQSNIIRHRITYLVHPMTRSTTCFRFL